MNRNLELPQTKTDEKPLKEERMNTHLGDTKKQMCIFHKCSNCYYYREYKKDLSFTCKLIHYRSKPGESKYCYHDQPCKSFKPKSQ